MAAATKTQNDETETNAAASDALAENDTRGATQSFGTNDRAGGGEAELRKDAMMTHLLDSLEAGKDIGHHGQFVFVSVARHFLSEDEIVRLLAQEPKFNEEAARGLYTQIADRGYNPPRREKILEYQNQQDFPIIPNPDDPDAGNVYRDLQFPDSVYEHISEYREQKAAAE